MELILNILAGIFGIALSLSIPGTLTGMILSVKPPMSKRKRFLSLLAVWVPYLWLMGIFAWAGQGEHMLPILVGALFCWGRVLFSEEWEF